MARLARVVVAGYPHPITQRGNRRPAVFFCDEDCQAYVDLLATWYTHYGRYLDLLPDAESWVPDCCAGVRGRADPGDQRSAPALQPPHQLPGGG